MCTTRCLIGSVPNVVFDGLMVSRFLSRSSVSVNHFGLGSEREQLCVSWQWSGSACVLLHLLALLPCGIIQLQLRTASATLLPLPCSGPWARPQKYRIRVTYSAVAIWKELLGVVAKPFYTGQEVLFREIISHAPSTREKLRLLQVSLTGWVSASNR